MGLKKAILVGQGVMGKRHQSRLEARGVDFVQIIDKAQNIGSEAISNGGLKVAAEPVDFAVVASPAETHFEYVQHFLKKGVPVFVEKPLAETASDAWELVRLSREAKVPLVVGHSESFNPAFQKFRRQFLENLRQQKGAEVRLFFRREHGYAERCRDVGAALDMMVHDVYLFLMLFDFKNVELESFWQSESGDEARMTLGVARGTNAGVKAEFYVNRVSDVEIRAIEAQFKNATTGAEAKFYADLALCADWDKSLKLVDAIDNEHKFFFKLLEGEGTCWGKRALDTAAQAVEIIAKGLLQG